MYFAKKSLKNKKTHSKRGGWVRIMQILLHLTLGIVQENLGLI